MGGKDFRHREKKKPKKKEARKVSWPTSTSEAEHVEVINPKGKKGEA